MRERHLVANWKMYTIDCTVEEYLKRLKESLNCDIKEPEHVLGLAVPFTKIAQMAGLCAEDSILVGAQNMHNVEEGAYTGEVALPMLKEANAHFVILGHSERRQLYHETDELIAQKVKMASEANLPYYLCVGERLEDRENDEGQTVVGEQIKKALSHVQSLKHLVIAYEPIWAIGTGQSASLEQIEKMHQFIRKQLIALNEAQGADVSILYGGSVKPENCRELAMSSDIDGFLVGKACLDPKKFAEIANKLFTCEPEVV